MSSNNTEDLFNSDELIKLAKKPAILVPLWEFFLAVIIAIVFSLLYFYGFFNTVENASIDYRFKQRGKLASSKDIVLISITDECIEKLGTWPWPRATHGKLLDILKKAGAKLAAFDIMFTEESLAGHEDDVQFAKSIANFGKVVLPQVITKKTILDPETFEEKSIISPDRPCKTLLEAKP
ncbi:MAG: CHASE2 domain-containing protein, partial [Candidatus Riflebacteria bacterium]|nr:CHASE2 domain-containing protein [Candidatus Riflebacteria bacterium]